jgi:hypothetical protein
MTIVPFEDVSSTSELSSHTQTYRKFVHWMQILACCTPILLAFVLYWTT